MCIKQSADRNEGTKKWIVMSSEYGVEQLLQNRIFVSQILSSWILVTHPEVPKIALDLMSRSCDLIICQSLPPDRSELLQKVQGVHGILWATQDTLDAEILDAAGPQLKVISTLSAGTEYVDIAELKKRNVLFGHTQNVHNAAVADIAMGLMLAAARRFHEGRRKIECSKCENHRINWMWGQEIRDATVGFFGFGGIGQLIAKRLSGFDIARVLYTTRNRISNELEKRFSATQVPFDELLCRSDIIFITAPLTDQTRHIFNATAFCKMKKSAVLVNIGRGSIIKQSDLYRALKTRKIFAAGVDVVENEPMPANDKLLTLPNFVITPHLGSRTERSRNDIVEIAAYNILRGMAGEPLCTPGY